MITISTAMRGVRCSTALASWLSRGGNVKLHAAPYMRTCWKAIGAARQIVMHSSSVRKSIFPGGSLLYCLVPRAATLFRLIHVSSQCTTGILSVQAPKV